MVAGFVTYGCSMRHLWLQACASPSSVSSPPHLRMKSASVGGPQASLLSLTTLSLASLALERSGGPSLESRSRGAHLVGLSWT